MLSAWRAVALAALRDEVLASLRVDAHARNAMWRAWRAWTLGPASVSYARGAPTPPVPTRVSFPKGGGGAQGGGGALGSGFGRVPVPVPARGALGVSGERVADAVDPAVAGGRAARAAGTAARRRVLGGVALAGWRRLASARSLGSPAGVQLEPLSGDRFEPSTLADAEALLAQTEAVGARFHARARVPLLRRAPSRTVARAVAAAEAAADDDGVSADDATSEMSEVPPIAAIDPEVYAAARREWRRSRGGT